MDDVQTVALAKMVKKAAGDKARGMLSVGVYEVDTTVKVSGTFEVFADVEKNVTASLPQKKMLLAALMLNGVCVESFIKRYLSGEFETTKEQEAKLDAMWEELADSTKGTTKGQVRTKLNYEIVEAVEVPAQTEKVEA